MDTLIKIARFLIVLAVVPFWIVALMMASTILNMNIVELMLWIIAVLFFGSIVLVLLYSFLEILWYEVNPPDLRKKKVNAIEQYYHDMIFANECEICGTRPANGLGYCESCNNLRLVGVEGFKDE